MKLLIPAYFFSLSGPNRLFTKYNLNDQVEVDDIGRACSTYGREIHAGI
jgi:hypothetical protein